MSAPAKHDLSLRDLTKVYDPHSGEQAVSELTLDVAEGEFVSLLGPSGSGKTTTLMMIAGFEDVTSGDILVDGSSIVGVPPHRRNIGVVFQNYALFPKMTVAQNINFPLRMRKRDGATIRDTVARLLDLIHLPGYEDRYPHQLSGGQQQRVALARALAFDPSLLLLDEPMGALDRKLREQLQLEVKHIQRSLGVTTVYVTHDQEEAMVLSDRIAIMDKGRVQQVGTPEQVYNRPANRFVAQFLGAANLLAAKVIASNESGGSGRALLAGVDVPFTAERPMPRGASVELFLRPECVQLGREDAAPLRGVVETAIFVGESTKLHVRVDADTVISVTSPNRTGSSEHAIGERVSVSWDADRAVALADESG